MKSHWKTARVFISSTFKDMHAERDYLVRVVFPKLREALIPLRIHLVDVDLRWGITGEVDALSACRDIVDECRPRFLCMLGGRYGWVPDGKNHSITADEVHYAVMHRLDDPGFSYFYFRNPAATNAVPDGLMASYCELPDSQNEQLLRELKDQVCSVGFKPFEYSPRWDSETGRFIGLEVFGERVYRDLWDGILEEYGDDISGDEPDGYESENAVMEAFSEEHNRFFVSGNRRKIIERLLSALQSPEEKRCYCITGPAGSGKTGLMAHLVQEIRQLQDQTDLMVLFHFAGAGYGSTHVESVIRRFCHQLNTKAGKEDELPLSCEEIRAFFRNQLAEVCRERPVVILVDGLDLFDPGSGSQLVGWLADEMPKECCRILSMTSRSLLEPFSKRLAVEEMCLPMLAREDAANIVHIFYNRYCKNLSAVQLEKLLSKPESLIPRYLSVALEDLRTLGNYEEITQRIVELPADTDSLFSQLIERLELESQWNDNNFVARLLSYIAVSRHGISENELKGIFIEKESSGDIATVIRLLRPHLMQRNELIDFGNEEMRLVVRKRYLAVPRTLLDVHEELAEYFRRGADPQADLTWQSEKIRPLLELSYHLVRAHLFSKLSFLLFDRNYLGAVCLKGKEVPSPAGGHLSDGVFQLLSVLQDIGFQLEASESGEACLIRERIGRLTRLLRDRGELLSRSPQLLFQEAANYLDGWNSEITAVQSPDHQLKLIRHFDQEAQGHSGGVCSISTNATGRFFVSGSSDGSVAFRNMEKKELLWSVSAHKGGTTSVALSPDGKSALSTGMEGGVYLWNTKDVSCRKLYTEHGRHGQVEWPSAATCCFIDDETVFFSRNRLVYVLDVLTGQDVWKRERRYRLVEESEHLFDYAPSTRKLVFMEESGGILITEAQSGAECNRFGINGRVSHLSFSKDGNLLLAANFQGDISFFDVMHDRLVGTYKCGKVAAVCCGHDVSDFLVMDVLVGAVALNVLENRVDAVYAQDWDLRLRTRFMSVAVAPGQERLMLGLNDGRVIIRNWEGQDLHTWESRINLSAGAILDNGKWALGICARNSQMAGYAAVGTRSIFIGLENGEIEEPESPHRQLVSGCASIDSRLSVSIDKSGLVVLWDGTQPGNIWKVDGADFIACAGWKLGEAAVCGTQDDRVCLIGCAGMLDEIECPGSLFDEGQPPGITAIAAQGHPLSLAVGYRNGCVRFMGKADWKQEGHVLMTTAVALTDDISLAASGSVAGEVVLWQVSDGRCLKRWSLHAGEVRSMTFSKDGKYLFCAGADRYIYAIETAAKSVVCGTVIKGVPVDIRSDEFGSLNVLDAFGCGYVFDYHFSEKADGHSGKIEPLTQGVGCVMRKIKKDSRRSKD